LRDKAELLKYRFLRDHVKTDEPVWAIVFFDLPVDTKAHRRDATRYRVQLLELGFCRIQLSVYAKYLINSSGLDWLTARVSLGIPDGGFVRMLTVTDIEWSKMLRIEGKKLVASEARPQQLTIF
jgi:CRISPR-associated protein Cas2